MFDSDQQIIWTNKDKSTTLVSVPENRTSKHPNQSVTTTWHFYHSNPRLVARHDSISIFFNLKMIYFANS